LSSRDGELLVEHEERNAVDAGLRRAQRLLPRLVELLRVGDSSAEKPCGAAISASTAASWMLRASWK
jgi:hypothetical protein